MTPRELWEKWQREGRPTLGSRKPLADFLFSNAQYDVETALVAHVKGKPLPPGVVPNLEATVRDLAQLCREAGR